MSGIQPMRGSIVRQGRAHDVVSPAYDALSVAQRKQFRTDHPESYLHVTRSAADEHDAATVDNTTLVQRGRAALEALLEQDLFVQHSETPCFYAYRLTIGGLSQTGLVCEIDPDYFVHSAKPHEATQASRAALLAEHFTTVKAASSPVACAVSDDGDLQDMLAEAARDEPVLELFGDDGLQQTVWAIRDTDLSARVAARLHDQSLYIIDGHHRAKANAQLLAAGTPVPLLTAIFPEQSLHLVGFHRMVKLPAGLRATDFIDLISRRFRVEITSDVATVAPGQVALVVDGEWHVVNFDERPVSGSTQVLLGSLDPVVLEREILQQAALHFGELDVTYAPDTEPFSVIVAEAEADGRVPIFVPPVAIADMMAVAEGGMIMPAKSTYFMPKVRSGIFLRLFDELS